MSLPSRERGLKLSEIRLKACKDVVAPFAGAWIEIKALSEWKKKQAVAPFAGAWIEIKALSEWKKKQAVAPFAGAWIEIQNKGKHYSLPFGRSLRGSVD